MPFTTPPKSKSKRKKKRGFFSRAFGSARDSIPARIASDLGNAARTAPGSVLQTARAVDEALPRGPLERGKRKHNDTAALEALLKAQIQATKNLGSGKEWREHPGYNLLTALGFVPIPGAAALKVSKVAGKAPKKPPTRTLRARDPKTGYNVKVEIPASRVPTTRAAQEIADKIRMRFPKLQTRRVAKEVARDKDIIGRLGDRPAPGFLESVKSVRKRGVKANLKAIGRHPVRETNAGVRSLRLHRPGYIPPNWLGANATNIIQQGTSYPANVFRRRELLKELKPESVGKIRSLMGEGVSQAASEITGTGPISEITRGVGTSLGKVTDRAARDRSFFAEARKQGYKTADEIETLLSDPRFRKDLRQVVRRAEAEAIRFSRSKPLPGRKTTLSKVDRKLADNIFLYRWLTGSSQYAGRMLTEHPTISAALAAQGRESPSIEDVLAEFPEFMRGYIPTGVKDAMPQVLNTQAASLFDMPGETARTLARATQDPRELAELLQPVQHAAALAYTGFNPFTGDQRMEDAPIYERIPWAAQEELKSSPYFKLFDPFSRSSRLTESEEKRGRRLFPMSNEELLRQFFAGGSFTPIPVNPEVAKSMGRQEDKRFGRKTPPKRKRRRKQSF